MYNNKAWKYPSKLNVPIMGNSKIPAWKKKHIETNRPDFWKKGNTTILYGNIASHLAFGSYHSYKSNDSGNNLFGMLRGKIEPSRYVQGVMPKSGV